MADEATADLFELIDSTSPLNRVDVSHAFTDELKRLAKAGTHPRIGSLGRPIYQVVFTAGGTRYRWDAIVHIDQNESDLHVKHIYRSPNTKL